MGQEEQIFGRCGTILTEYPGDAPEIQVPGDITEVARYVFYGKEVQRAELPDGLSRLQEGAFRSCRKLQQIRLPNTLNTIDRYAFADCWKLEQASLSEGLEKIEDYAFHRTALKTVRIPDTVMEIGDHAFDTRGTLKIAVVPGSVRMIGRKAFSGAPGLTIHTQPGSAAETYARKNGIAVSYETAAQQSEQQSEHLQKPPSRSSEAAPVELRRTIYETLGQAQKACYGKIAEGLMAMEPVIDLQETRAYVLEINSIWDAIELDHPEIFWVDWNKTSTGNPAQLRPVYWLTREQRETRQQELDAAAAELLTGLRPEMGDYDKAITVFRRLISSVDYDSVGLARQKETDWKDRGVDDLRTVYGSLVKKRCVCVGYAVGYQYLLQKLGMEAVQRVSWKIEDEDSGHAWTIVKMDGEYYHIDVTHSDGSNTDPQKDSKSYSMCHFGVTDEEIDKIWKPGDKRLPKCTGTKCNYFVHEGLYFAVYDQEKITAALREKLKAPSVTQVELKLDSPEAASRAFEWLRTSGILSRLYMEAGRSGEISIAQEKYNVIKVLFE